MTQPPPVTAYIYYRHEGYQIQKTVILPSGSEHEIFWAGNLTLPEAISLTENCATVHYNRSTLARQP